MNFKLPILYQKLKIKRLQRDRLQKSLGYLPEVPE